MGVCSLLIVLKAKPSVTFESVKCPTNLEHLNMFVCILSNFSSDALNNVCKTVSKCWVMFISACHIIMYNSSIDLMRVASTQSPISFRIPGKILLAFNRINSLQPKFGLLSLTFKREKIRKLEKRKQTKILNKNMLKFQ